MKSKEELLAYKREQYQKHREHNLIASKEYYQQHRERKSETRQLWSSTNKERLQEIRRNWKQNNKDKVKTSKLLRKAKEKGILFKLTAAQTEEVLSRGCFFADNTCSGPLTVAHDTPVSKGGNTTRGNTFCLCLSHNSRMQTKQLKDLLKQKHLF
jgi:hypothetical protein